MAIHRWVSARLGCECQSTNGLIKFDGMSKSHQPGGCFGGGVPGGRTRGPIRTACTEGSVRAMSETIFSSPAFRSSPVSWCLWS